MADKTYQPDTIDEVALPNESVDGLGNASNNSNSTVSNVYKPSEIVDSNLPQAVVATEIPGIVDQSGIIGRKSFNSGIVYKYDEQQIIHGTGVSAWHDITSLTLSLNIGRDAFVLFLATIQGVSNINNASLDLMFNLDNNRVGPLFSIGGQASPPLLLTATGTYITILAPGTHTIKMQAANFSSSDSEWVSPDGSTSSLMYMTLGS